VDSSGSENVSLSGCCECGDEPLISGATELVSYLYNYAVSISDYITSNDLMI
jgi:hypothetical protein